MISRILVVCTGNICRSPIAEKLLQHLGPKLTVTSAGVGAMTNWPADPLAVELMAESGHDISAHRARQLTRVMLTESDLVLTLDRHHNEWINARFLEHHGKVHKLLFWRGNADVPDPYRQSKAVFEEAYKLISQGVDDWMKKLR